MTDAGDELERREEGLAAIPVGATGLSADREREFRRARRRIGRHHRGWRAGMPTLETLFDDEAHRARALAGSVCTELEDVLITWGRLRAADGAVDDDAARFVDRTAARWREQALDLADPMGWEGASLDVYRGFIDDLAERARVRGRAALRGDAAPVREPPGRLRLLVRRLVRKPLLAARRLFRPVS